jgi:MFS family permease
MDSSFASSSTASEFSGQKKLFWACFIALVATSFTFIGRILNMDAIAEQYALSETQKGEIMGIGIAPFGISIVVFSLIIDRIGYFKAIIFAFVCHTAFAILTVTATGYWGLYIGAALGGLAAGAIEAAINPIVATIFVKDKTKWLNLLHAGWPAGLVLAGILNIVCEGAELSWEGRIMLVFLPVVAYGIMMATCRFPLSERVAAGVSYRKMLQEVGFLGALIAFVLIGIELGRAFNWHTGVTWTVIGLSAGAFGIYTRAIGRPLFIILTIIMMPLAITELGTDSWITDLMKPEMNAVGLNAGWVLVYTSFIMMVLRFCAGPIVHAISPLGLLTISAALAICGLMYLSSATGAGILIAATLYGFGKTFFWPTMLGVVSEQCPKGGAMTLNLIAGVGMLAAGIVGNPLLGNLQDKEVDHVLKQDHAAVHAQVMGEKKNSVFGSYSPIDDAKVALAGDAAKATIEKVKAGAKKSALFSVAIFPAIMLLAYVSLMLYFRSKGGYKPVDLLAEGSDDGST